MRVLEDHLHILFQPLAFLSASSTNVHSSERNAAFIRLYQPKNKARGGRFPTARFAHHAEGRSWSHSERNIVDSRNEAGLAEADADWELLSKSFDLDSQDRPLHRALTRPTLSQHCKHLPLPKRERHLVDRPEWT